jgi:lipopolysaccharide biosynthesis glycosyltransferase
LNPLRVIIGYDKREPISFEKAERSLRAHASVPVHVTKLDIVRLAEQGLLRRPTDRRGVIYDLPSNAPASTDFAISRFLCPMLLHDGWGLFVDSDVVFTADVADLFALADPQYAVMVVKHRMPESGAKKMDGQAQTAYPRKNWSSVVLWNADHPANCRLSLVDVQERRGFDLHQFYWLADNEIGELPPEWNVLVGVDDMPADPKLLHWTLGTPELIDNAPHAHIWHAA